MQTPRSLALLSWECPLEASAHYVFMPGRLFRSQMLKRITSRNPSFLAAYEPSGLWMPSCIWLMEDPSPTEEARYLNPTNQLEND